LDIRFRQATSSLRCLPDFIIVGAQKCGTTTLYEHLRHHPQVLASPKNEVHYFDLEYERGISWYRSHFPLSQHLRFSELTTRKHTITGETSPFYFAHPDVPRRMHIHVPNTKLLVVLRDPVDRAWSHYRHWKRLNWEKLSFKQALLFEDSRIKDDIDSCLSRPNARGVKLAKYSYKFRGLYLNALKRLWTYFPKEQCKIIIFEEFLASPQLQFNQICNFLGIDNLEINHLLHLNAGGDIGGAVGQHQDPHSIPTECFHLLMSFFKEPNQHLSIELGRKLPWK